MSKVSLTPAVTRTQVVEVSPPKIVLEMTKEEAEAVRAVFQFVGGAPSTTRRGLIEDMDHVLYGAGIQKDTSDISRPNGGGIMFLPK